MVNASPNESLVDIKETLISELSEMKNKFVEIHDLIAVKLKYDKTKEQAFERLYLELDEYKKNKAFEDSKPLYIDLILLYDRIQQSRNDHDTVNGDVLDSIQDELIEILLRRDIEITRKADDSFDPSTQRIVETQEVNKTSLDGKVIDILRDGFMYKGAILRPQEVVVGKLRLPANESDLIGEIE